MRSSIHSKKGSLSLSINAIVIVVLAFVMLGLGLTLTRSVLNQAQDTAIQVGDQTRDQILDTLREGSKKIAFPSKKISLESGEKEVIAFGVKNTRDTTLKYCIAITKVAGPDGDTDVANGPARLTSGQASGDFFWAEIPKSLTPGESDVLAIEYKSEDRKGSYLYKIALANITDTASVCPPAADPVDEFAATDFFVTIN